MNAPIIVTELAFLSTRPGNGAALEAAGVMCEGMSTPSAARTYNVLLSEGRRVAAALLPMPGEAP